MMIAARTAAWAKSGDPVKDLIAEIPNGWVPIQAIKYIGGGYENIVRLPVLASIGEIKFEIVNNTPKARLVYAISGRNSYLVQLLNGTIYISGGATINAGTTGHFLIEILSTVDGARISINDKVKTTTFMNYPYRAAIGTDSYNESYDCDIKAFIMIDANGTKCNLVPVSSVDSVAFWDRESKNLLMPTYQAGFVAEGNKIENIADCSNYQKKLWFGIEG